MNKLAPIRLGFAFGITGAIAYALCAVIKAVLPRETEIRVANSLMHGIDVTTILREEMPVSDMVFGLVGTFVIAALLGALVAWAYDLTLLPRAHGATPVAASGPK